MRRSLLLLSLLAAPAGAVAQQPTVPQGPLTLLQVNWVRWKVPMNDGVTVVVEI